MMNKRRAGTRQVGEIRLGYALAQHRRVTSRRMKPWDALLFHEQDTAHAGTRQMISGRRSRKSRADDDIVKVVHDAPMLSHYLYEVTSNSKGRRKDAKAAAPIRHLGFDRTANCAIVGGK